MTGQRPLAVIHTRRGATGLQAPNHLQLLVALPCPVLETKVLGDGFQFFGGFAVTFRGAVLGFYQANYQQESFAWHVVREL